MNKLLSKKNGFTLVEILVAFVIFAIMSTMVMSIVQLAIKERSSINEYSKNLAVQEEDLVRKDKIQEYDDAVTPAGTFSFAFQNEDGDAKGSTTIDYQIHSTDDEKNSDNIYQGVNYFIGDVEYNNTPIQDDDDDDGGASQAGRYDTRITGTKGYMYVKMAKVQKDPTYTGTGVRYLFSTTVLPDTTDSISLKFAQYKVYFKNTNTSTTKTVTRDDGNEYTYTVPDSAKILSAGYVNSISLDPTQCSTSRENTFNPYKLTVLRNGAIQIGYDYANGGNRDFSKGAGTSYFYVIFETDPDLDVDDFGENGTRSGSACEYTTFVDSDGKTQPNIYGAYNFVYTPK